MSYSAWERAQTFLLAGETADALDALREHLASTPDDDEARRVFARLLLADDDLEGALAAFAALRETGRDDMLIVAGIHARRDDLAGALAAVQAALRHTPDDPRLRDAEMDYALRAGAFDYARLCAARQPEGWRSALWLGKAAEAAATPDAANHYRRALTLLPEGGFWHGIRQEIEAALERLAGRTT